MYKILLLFIILQITFQKTLSSQFDVSNPLSKNNLVGTYTIGDECSNLRCSEADVFNYWLDYPFMCPQSDTNATIEYNEKENFYTLKMEAHFALSSNTFFKIDFDDMFFYQQFIMIPMKLSGEFINMVIEPCGMVGQMDFINCNTDGTDFQLVVSRQKFSRYGYSENDNGCQFILTKTSDKVEKLDIEKEQEENDKENNKNNQKNNKNAKSQGKSKSKSKQNTQQTNNTQESTKIFDFPLTQDELVGQYTVGDQCGYQCDPLYPVYPFTPGGFDNFLDCPISESVASIVYNQDYDYYTLNIEASNGWFHTDQSAVFEFSKINFYTEKSLIYIPLMDRYSGSDNKGDKFYYDLSSMTIMPCWLKGEKKAVSKNCSKNKNIIELSVQKWINKPLWGEPCGFTLTKITNDKNNNNKNKQNNNKNQKTVVEEKLQRYKKHYKTKQAYNKLQRIQNIQQLSNFFLKRNNSIN